MKGKRPPLARFKTESEVMAAIDRKTELVAKLKERAIKWDEKATALFESIQDWPDSTKRAASARDATAMREKANRMRSRSERIERNYLQRLKGKLAVIRTGQLPILDNHDPSIPK